MVVGATVWTGQEQECPAGHNVLCMITNLKCDKMERLGSNFGQAALMVVCTVDHETQPIEVILFMLLV